MALEIKAIPTLKGERSRTFREGSGQGLPKEGEKTDFSKQVKIARAILKKANML